MRIAIEFEAQPVLQSETLSMAKKNMEGEEKEERRGGGEGSRRGGNLQ